MKHWHVPTSPDQRSRIPGHLHFDLAVQPGSQWIESTTWSRERYIEEIVQFQLLQARQRECYQRLKPVHDEIIIEGEDFIEETPEDMLGPQTFRKTWFEATRTGETLDEPSTEIQPTWQLQQWQKMSLHHPGNNKMIKNKKVMR